MGSGIRSPICSNKNGKHFQPLPQKIESPSKSSTYEDVRQENQGVMRPKPPSGEIVREGKRHKNRGTVRWQGRDTDGERKGGTVETTEKIGLIKRLLRKLKHSQRGEAKRYERYEAWRKQRLGY